MHDSSIRQLDSNHIGDAQELARYDQRFAAGTGGQFDIIWANCHFHYCTRRKEARKGQSAQDSLDALSSDDPGNEISLSNKLGNKTGPGLVKVNIKRWLVMSDDENLGQYLSQANTFLQNRDWVNYFIARYNYFSNGGRRLNYSVEARDKDTISLIKKTSAHFNNTLATNQGEA